MPTLPLSDHLNLLWSSLIVSEFIKNGIDTFFISPGNRNAPLISALAYEDRALKKISFDERAAGFRALGYAKATGRPGVLVCTSGTAPANYYPAVIEASREDIPMIILSADRPPELIGSDANQTIIQENLYGRYCRDSLFLPCPDADYPLDALLTKLDHIINHLSGPVHINCPFRDPLTPGVSGAAPIPAQILKKARQLFGQPKPYTAYSPKSVVPDIRELLVTVQNTRRGLVIVGRLDTHDDTDALESLLGRIDWPVFCDIASSLKGTLPADRQIFSLDHPEAIRLIKDYNPDTILQFGSGLVSKHYYASILPQSKAKVIQISPRSGLRDPAHRVTLRIVAPVSTVAKQLAKEPFPTVKPDAYVRLMMPMGMLRLHVKQYIEQETLSFALIASMLSEAVPEDEGMFAGNSIAIRAFDAVLPAIPRKIRIISNRGVSGIEGNIATSVGYAEAISRRVTAVIGDISFLHDLNSLLLMKQSTVAVILIVVNNGGGRIFERLPMNNFPEVLNPYMTTPHDMNFKHLALQFDLSYFKIAKPQELIRAYQKALKNKTSALLEVILSPEDDLRIFKAMQQVRLP
jgi:2-succinyl-5-enolpyruvyl-6-hydroxy-3-cyclohexene-1-carboxylate synthase